VLPEITSAPATEASMVPTVAVAAPRAPGRKADSRRRVVQNVAPPHTPLILGIRH
jgi:hypothetical protein